MNKKNLWLSLVIIGGSYSAVAYCADGDKVSKAQQDRIEMENKQATLMHTEDFVSQAQGARTRLLQAPVKKDDAVTNHAAVDKKQ